LEGEARQEPRIPCAGVSRRAFHGWERFACGRRGTAVMFAWAAAESTVWPIIPDFLLLPMAVAQRRRSHIPLIATILGSALGGAAWHAWASIAPDAALRSLRRIPLVRASHISEVEARIARDGSNALFRQPWSGIGLKVWAPVAASSGIAARRALPTFIAMRALRMALVTAVTAMLSRALARWIEALAVPLAATYLVLFFRLWWRIVTRDYAHGDT
jgi:membrane protein YqaA with SNARE-associated domain